MPENEPTPVWERIRKTTPVWEKIFWWLVLLTPFLMVLMCVVSLMGPVWSSGR